MRHSPDFYFCSFEFESESRALITLSEDDQGLAPGQFSAFYLEDTCLGSGVILETLDLEVSGVPSEEAKIAAKLPWEPEIGPKLGKKKLKREERRRKIEEAREGETSQVPVT